MLTEKRVANEKHVANANTVIQGAKLAVELLRTTSESTNTPYLRAIAGASALLMDTVVVVRKNKEECLRMAEQVVTIITALVDICTNNSELSPSILNSIATFSETLQKVLMFVRNQVGKSLVKRVIRHLEDASALSECQSALGHAVQLFKLQCEIATAAALAQIQTISTKRNCEFVNLVMGSESRSTIFHGRDTELQHVVSTLVAENSSRIAILGPGGIGKTSLALAVLYNQEVATKFQSERHFIPCEWAQCAGDIAAALLSHFALEKRGNPMKAVLQHFSRRKSPCVVVLDNLETAWEVPEGRSAVEEILSHLSDINMVHLIITMRGEERPMKVRWTRPFLRPLSPLSDIAAKQVFCDITDMANSGNQVEELLLFTDNLPLAITLMASLVSFEGPSPVLFRWKSERMSALSELSKGADKGSNLGTSIMMSLTSPRLTAVPDAITLLRLLSILPDGVTDATLAEMKLPLGNISLCRATLCRTSLAYVHQGRLKALVPIREHMRAFHPPSRSLISLLQDFFYQLVNLFAKKWARDVGGGLVQRLSADLGNIHSLLHIALEAECPSRETIACIIDLARFTEVTDLGSWDLLRSISETVEKSDDPDLQGQYFIALSRVPNLAMSAAMYMQKAIIKFEVAGNVSAQAMAYHDLCLQCLLQQGDTNKAQETCRRALVLARSTDDHNVLAQVLKRMASVEHQMGNLRSAWAFTLEAHAHAQLAGDLDTEFSCNINRVSHFITAGNYQRASALATDLISLAKGLDETKAYYALALRNTFLIDVCMGKNITHESIDGFRRLRNGAHWVAICDPRRGGPLSATRRTGVRV
ncbi:hypothetical protein B0H14DRAFT_3593982 [Mycena olivaceomarginata]|nr:hypothetical protein B0H14DRAFT_3593982 [Mycena olivaceomarginata]